MEARRGARNREGRSELLEGGADIAAAGHRVDATSVYFRAQGHNDKINDKDEHKEEEEEEEEEEVNQS